MSTQHIYSTLLADFPYFKKLDVAKRSLLCKRTEEFIKLTKFVAKGDLVLTDRMIILIAACSQQLTLAFKDNYLYNHFKRILVYPGPYYSPFSKTENIGEMNTAGVIIFSWEDFYKGLKLHDNKNVGLHEFAHALEFIDIARKDTDDRFSYALDKEFMIARDYMLHKPETPFFRSYAATNKAEFFAVATEYFFESPQEFFNTQPDIYAVFCKIYGQDPRPQVVSFEPYPSKPLKSLGEPLVRGLNTSIRNSAMIIFVIVFFNVIIYNSRGAALSVLQLSFMIGLVLGGLLIYHFSPTLKFYEQGIKINRGLIFKFASLLFPAIRKRKLHAIGYDDVFSCNVTGDFYEEEPVIKRKSPTIVMKVHYYEYGNIRSSSLSLSSSKQCLALMERLFLEKKVCVRLDGQIKSFE